MSGPMRVVRAPPEPSDDAALFERCASGDAEALGLLFDRHSADVWRFLSRLVGRTSPELDDLGQQTFVELWRSAGRYRSEGSARVFIFGIANNLVRHHLRGHGRRRVALTMLSSGPAPAPRPIDEAIGDKRALERIALALPELSPEHREVFVMCDLEEIRGVDAAKILGLRRGTLARRLHEARKILRAALEEGP